MAVYKKLVGRATERGPEGSKSQSTAAIPFALRLTVFYPEAFSGRKHSLLTPALSPEEREADFRH